MKKLVLVFTLAGLALIYSCGCSEASCKMADEMCEAMENYQYDDQISMAVAACDMHNILLKTDEYGHVTSTDLKRAMMKRCPHGWKKYESLQGK